MSKSTASLDRTKVGSLATKLAIGILGMLAFTVVPLILVLIPGMMPTLVTLLVDRQRPRYLSCTVGAMNFSGVLPILLTVLKGHLTMTAAGLALTNPVTWIVMYGAAAAGWLIWGATPPLARLCLDIQANQRRRSLEALGKAVQQEWGEEVAGPQSQPAVAQVERARRP